MSLKIYTADDLPGESWSELTGNSFYSSPQFVRLWRTINGHEIFFLDTATKNPVAGMAGVIFGSRFLRRFQSMPDGLSGGPYYSADCDEEGKNRFMNDVVSWLKSNSFIRADIHNSNFGGSIEAFRRNETKTHIIGLNENQFKAPSGKIGEHIRTGKRRGATVAILRDEKHLNDFFELAVKTGQRHGSKPRYPKRFFAELLKLSADENRMLWLAVFAENKMIGSRICFIDHRRLLTWQYYSDKKYSSLKPGYLLLDYIIDYAIDRDIETIDLGGTPADAKSLIEYKERWGGRIEINSYCTYFSRLGRIIYGGGRKKK